MPNKLGMWRNSYRLKAKDRAMRRPVDYGSDRQPTVKLGAKSANS